MEQTKLWSVEAEAGVLGSMMLDKDCIAKVLAVLPSAEAFFDEQNKIIYNALTKAYFENPNLDLVDGIILRDQLKTTGQLEDAGGVEYIGKILNSVPSSANAEYYAKIVRDKQRYREALSAIEKISKLPDDTASADELIEKAQDLILAFDRPQLAKSTKPTDIAAAMRDGEGELVETGFRNVDRIIQGVQPGELVIIAGRPSMGKSALMLDIALNVSKHTGVVIFTLEMSEWALYERALCNIAGVNLASAKARLIIEDDWNAIDEAVVELERRNFVLISNCKTPEQQIGLIRRLKQTHDIGLVCIDYLQLMSIAGKSESRLQEVSTISRKLKLAAIKENVPIIALSQLNREVENRPRHRPRMSDLRETGALEQDADIVMLLHREDYYRLSEEPDAAQDGRAELIIAKNRRGPVGLAPLVFLNENAKFSDLTESEEILCSA